MILNYKNENEINNINLHDSEITKFNYDFNNKLLFATITNRYSNKNYNFKFLNMFYLEIQSCRFWGEGCRILEWGLSKNKKNEKNLRLLQSEDNNNLKESFSSEKNYLDLTLYFNSGDQIIIVCEEIEIL